MAEPKPNKEYIFEAEPADILSLMLQLFFTTTITRCLQESIASELGALGAVIRMRLKCDCHATVISECIQYVYWKNISAL